MQGEDDGIKIVQTEIKALRIPFTESIEVEEVKIEEPSQELGSPNTEVEDITINDPPQNLKNYSLA